MIYKAASDRPDVVLVTFEFPADLGAHVVHLVGDFNAWNRRSHPMEQANHSGPWTITLELPAGKEFQFRYLVDGTRWYNDWDADAYTPNPYGGRNSVVITTVTCPLPLPTSEDMDCC